MSKLLLHYKGGEEYISETRKARIEPRFFCLGLYI